MTFEDLKQFAIDNKITFGFCKYASVVREDEFWCPLYPELTSGGKDFPCFRFKRNKMKTTEELAKARIKTISKMINDLDDSDFKLLLQELCYLKNFFCSECKHRGVVNISDFTFMCDKFKRKQQNIPEDVIVLIETVKQFKTIDEINIFIKNHNYVIDSITPVVIKIRTNDNDSFPITEFIVVFKEKK